MAVVLLQLKLAIQRRALGHSGGGQRALFVAGWILALVLGLGVGAVVDLLASQQAGLGDLGLVLLLSAVFLGWAFSPLLLPGISDQTVDPARLEQFPLTARTQVLGLLLGALVSPTALFTLLVAAGGTVAAGESVPARVFIALAAVVFTVLCVAVSRAVQAALADVMQSRRARDVMLLLTGAFSLGIYLLSRAAHNVTQMLIDLENGTVEQALSWLPPGSTAQGMIAVRDGLWGSAGVHLVVALLGIAAAAAAWGWAIRRRVRGTSGGPARSRREPSNAAGLVLVPLPLAALPASPTMAAAAQQLRYYFFREPRALQTIVVLPIMGAFLAHTTIAESGLVVGIVMFVAMTLLAVAFYFFSYDGQGFSYLVLSGAPLRQVLHGKLLAAVVLLWPLMTVLLLVEATLTGQWGEALAGFLVGTNVAVLGLGVGAAFSVLAPRNQVGGGGKSRGAIVLSLAGIGVLAAVIVGYALVLLLFQDSVETAVLGALTLPVTATLASLLVRWAGDRLVKDPGRVERLLVGA